MPKTIFGTTEKSNFILNMKEDKVEKIFCLTLAIIGITVTVGPIVCEMHNPFMAIYLAVIAIVGITNIVSLVIAICRGMVKKDISIPFAMASLMAIFALISMNLSIDPFFSDSVFGSAGRYEGFITVLSYMAIFCLGVVMARNFKLIKIMDIFVGAGVFQCGYSLLQMLPIDFPSYYRGLYFIYAEGRGNEDVDLLMDIYLPSGLTGSPIMFAGFLALVGGIAIIGGMYDNSKKRRILYTISSAIFIMFAVFTQTTAGLLTAGLLIALSLAIEVIRYIKSGKEKCLGKPSIKLIVLVCVSFGACLIFLKYTAIIDAGVMWQDSYYRLMSTGPYVESSAEFKISDNIGAYKYLWGRALEIIKLVPIFGVGPDCLHFTQMANYGETLIGVQNSFDRVYNDYLQVAATRGIPSLVVYLSMVGYSITSLIRSNKLFTQDKSNWIIPAVLVSVVTYSVVMVIGVSSITVAPIFWVLLGFGCSVKLSRNCK